MSRTPTRIYLDTDLDQDLLRLDERNAHYVSHVLRLNVGDSVIVFDGNGTEKSALIERLSRRESLLRTGTAIEPLADGKTKITLLQGLIKPDRMDLIMQKATELGVSRIVAVRTDFSAVKLAAERVDQKLAHWSRIAASACEQCGRHFLPEIGYSRSLADALGERPPTETKIAFHNARHATPTIPGPELSALTLTVGPEGGFSPSELELLAIQDCVMLRLGKRTLRAETAAIVACTLAQLRWGDLS